jgi:uncharacterized membrane protein YdjX (TVP38/TMEM64 family)
MTIVISNKYFKYAILSVWIFVFSFIILNDNFKTDLLFLCNVNQILAPLVFILIQLILSILALPCSPLTVLAGVIWGLEIGLCLSITSTLTSSITTFLLGKYILKNLIKDRDVFNFWHKIKQIITKHDWKSSLVAHCNPFFPGSSLGYLFGAAEIPFKSFFLGCLLGTIPLQITAIYIGIFLG